MKKETFDIGYVLLVKSFQDKQMDKGILWEFLKDLTDEEFSKAIKEIISSTDEINKSTNVVAMIRTKALCGEQKTAGEAWEEVLNLVQRIGSYSYPSYFSSEAVKKSVNAIGWRQICLSETPMVERAHFLKIYETISEREKNKILSKPIKLLISDTTKQIGHK